MDIRPKRWALLALAVAGLAAAPAQKPFPASGMGMTGQVAMQELKDYARSVCRKKFGNDDAFALEDVACDANPAVRVTFSCRAKARCDGPVVTKDTAAK
jgi:hypothetical protein